MDLAKLIAQRDKFVADAAAALDRRGLPADATNQPRDLQSEQAERIRQRIEGLERRKRELVASIDTELAELKRDLKAREQKTKAERSGEGKPPAPSTGGAPEAKKTKIAVEPAAKKASLTARAGSKKKRPAARKGK